MNKNQKNKNQKNEDKKNPVTFMSMVMEFLTRIPKNIDTRTCLRQVEGKAEDMLAGEWATTGRRDPSGRFEGVLTRAPFGDREMERLAECVLSLVLHTDVRNLDSVAREKTVSITPANVLKRLATSEALASLALGDAPLPMDATGITDRTVALAAARGEHMFSNALDKCDPPDLEAILVAAEEAEMKRLEEENARRIEALKMRLRAQHSKRYGSNASANNEE